MIGAMIAIFVVFGVLVGAFIILICCCKCKRANKPDAPVSTRDFDLQEMGEASKKRENVEPAKPSAAEARRKAMEEKYGRKFGERG